MALWQTDLLAGKVRLDKLDKQIGNLDALVDEHEWAALVQFDPSLQERWDALSRTLAATGLELSHLRSLGTIGRGNHFAELQVVDRMECADTAAPGWQARACNCWCTAVRVAWASDPGRSSGSRRPCRPADSEAAAYLQQHDAAVQFAELNRALIGARILHRRCRSTLVLDVNHNTVTPALIDGQRGWLHRKGRHRAIKDCDAARLA
jgi:release factor H-coupled RctB family protein